jgi:hypothetical protein
MDQTFGLLWMGLFRNKQHGRLELTSFLQAKCPLFEALLALVVLPKASQ